MIGIVGASGLIGHNLFNFLRAHGEQVMGTYCSTKKHLDPIRFVEGGFFSIRHLSYRCDIVCDIEY
jgi:NAD dependent epimerase/dehydratase family enzyme